MKVHQLGGERAQGFAALSKADRVALASLGGKAAINRHTFSHREAVAAGRKGGRGNKKRRVA